MTNECRNINKTADIEDVLSVLLRAEEKSWQKQMLMQCIAVLKTILSSGRDFADVKTKKKYMLRVSGAGRFGVGVSYQH